MVTPTIFSFVSIFFHFFPKIPRYPIYRGCKIIIIIITRSALGRAHLPLTTVFRRLKSKPRVAAAMRAQYGFSRRNKIFVAVHTL